MADLERSLSSTVELTLGGKTYKASKITLADLAEYERYFKSFRRKQIIESAKEVYGDKVPDSAFRLAVGKPSDDDRAAFDESSEGMAYLLYLSLRRYNPSLTYADVQEMVHLEDLQDLSAIFGEPEKKTQEESESNGQPQ